MNFFSHQDAARAASRRFVALLVLGIVGLLIAVNVLTTWGLSFTARYHDGGSIPYIHWIVTVGTLAIVAVGSWLKMRELAGGGPTLAVLLGGREVLPSTANAGERRLRNVVEEMAIAAGIPVPAVFVLESRGINAFAAGHRLDDTAIAVTTGCLEHLTRDELQAVVGHETSHLLNGDAQLNLRLMGAVHGLFCICHIGRLILNSSWEQNDWYDGRRQRTTSFPVLLAGLAMMLIGSLGWLMAQVVRACVSRQREFLADAAAVQFTRNGSAMANVLKKALASGIGTAVNHPQAPLASQLFFANALSPGRGFFSRSLFASHPPLLERIRRLEPTWDGQPAQLTSSFNGQESVPVATHNSAYDSAHDRWQNGPAQPPLHPLPGLRSPVLPGPEQVDFAGDLLRLLPDSLTAAAGETYSARAAIVLTLLSPNPLAQLTRIRATDQTLAVLVERLLPAWHSVDATRARLPLVHLALGALRRLSPTQRTSLLTLIADLSRLSDERGKLAAHIIQANLSERRGPTDFHAFAPLLGDIATVVGSIAASSTAPDEAFRAGWQRLLIPGTAPMLPARPVSEVLMHALNKLARANGAIRRRVVEACGFTVAADGRVTADEAEYLRLVCEMLGQPLPIFRDRSA